MKRSARGERFRAPSAMFQEVSHELPYGFSIGHGFEQTVNKMLTLLLEPQGQGKNEQGPDILVAVHVDLLPMGLEDFPDNGQPQA